MARILIVDDEPNLRAAIAALFRARGYEVEAVESGEAAIEAQQREAGDIVVLDLVLPGLSGLETFARLRQLDPTTLCVFITAHGSVPSAVDAMRAGGYDYLEKPFDNDRLVLTVQRALERRGLTVQVEQLEQDLAAQSAFSAIVGRSSVLREALRRLTKVAVSDATVLLTGESGTGKELAARSLHRTSRRASGAFVAVNCGAIAPTLAETELFGHERGAFTDARGSRRGRFEQAHHGTLFLDEVGELTLDLQVKLLRVIQEGELCRVGAELPVRVDVRLIAATNRDLGREVAAGRFRDDLFWRLNVFQVEMPALRHRREDLPLLVNHILDRVNVECRTSVTGVAPVVLEHLNRHHWPGNVRELTNVLRHAVIMADGSVIQLADLPEYLSAAVSDAGSPQAGTTLERAMAATERRLVQATLERFKGNRSAAAAALGIDRRTLYNKLRRYQDESP